MKQTILGLSLALVTALNLGFYEKVAKNGSYILVCLGSSLYYFIIASIIFLARGGFKPEVRTFFYDANNWVAIVFYVLTMSLSYIFYLITKNTDVEMSSVYDLLYVPMLFILSIFHDHRKIDLDFIIAALLILTGVFIIARK